MGPLGVGPWGLSTYPFLRGGGEGKEGAPMGLGGAPRGPLGGPPRGLRGLLWGPLAVEVEERLVTGIEGGRNLIDPQ